MRALQCEAWGTPDSVVLRDDLAPRTPGAEEVVIRVAYASVSHATGLMVAGRYQTRPPLPFTPGTEAVGTVLAVGANVTRLSVGQRVVAIADWGCFAEQLVVRQHTVYAIPDAVSFLQALPVPISYGTAFTGMLWRSGLTAGETVLVLGAGAGVGLAAVEIAAAMGARVIACASTQPKRDQALARGASHAVAPDEHLAAQVKQATAGRGVDLVVDPVGGDLFERAVRACAANARLLSIGFASGRPPQVAANIFLVKNLTLHGFFFGRYIGWTPADERAIHAPALQHAIETLLGWVADGRLQPVVSQVFPISGLSDAIHVLESRQVIGKVALKISD